MRCHYEVLGVSFDANLEDIKAAYKQGALTWHPGAECKAALRNLHSSSFKENTIDTDSAP